SSERLTIDQNVHLIMPYHRCIDIARETRRGAQKIGTTGRGIGPCYEDRASRMGVRVADLLRMDSLLTRIEGVLEEKNSYLRDVLKSSDTVTLDEVRGYVDRAAQLLLPHIGNISVLVDDARRLEKRIVFEGAQGTLLDQTHGTIPYVTSSSTVTGAVLTGCGVGPRVIDHVLGVAKAYCTRVGEGPFPTELSNEIGERLRSIGGEFGTVTGRARRCGWFDGVLARKAVRLNGIDTLALTKLDVLSGLEKIEVCVSYRLNGKKCEDVPVLAEELAEVEPVYVTFDGWEEGLGDVRKWHQLPQNARFYLSSLSEIVGCDISIVSVGPERDSTIFAHGAKQLQNFISQQV
ncbi:MAG: adenylosuccinate synthase, partial [Bdellovibrionales bacterium]|nr:adenylosuccinate synthase [Bdellovibrionales bacterium]